MLGNGMVKGAVKTSALIFEGWSSWIFRREATSTDYVRPLWQLHRWAPDSWAPIASRSTQAVRLSVGRSVGLSVCLSYLPKRAGSFTSMLLSEHLLILAYSSGPFSFLWILYYISRLNAFANAFLKTLFCAFQRNFFTFILCKEFLMPY